jgi:uncharacterized protein YjiS (DUF1127 family)
MVVYGLKMLSKGVSLYLIALSDAIVDRQEARRNTDALSSLDERMLKDIGLSAADVEAVRKKMRGH